jgi:hypothetical protein
LIVDEYPYEIVLVGMREVDNTYDGGPAMDSSFLKNIKFIPGAGKSVYLQPPTKFLL